MAAGGGTLLFGGACSPTLEPKEVFLGLETWLGVHVRVVVVVVSELRTSRDGPHHLVVV
jgi:hypothetical protein